MAGVAAACARRVDPMVGEPARLGPAGGRAGRVGPGRVPGPGGRGVRRGGGRNPVPWRLLPVRPGTPAGDRGARVEGRGVDVEHGCVEIVARGRLERSDRPSGGHAGSGRAQGDRAPAAGSRARAGSARRWRVAGVDAPRHGGIVGPAGGHDPVGERELRVRDLRRGPAQGRGPRPGPAHGTRSGRGRVGRPGEDDRRPGPGRMRGASRFGALVRTGRPAHADPVGFGSGRQRGPSSGHPRRADAGLVRGEPRRGERDPGIVRGAHLVGDPVARPARAGGLDARHPAGRQDDRPDPYLEAHEHGEKREGPA